MRVDFHVHSTASDGTLAPTELVDKAVDGGFAALALTDHDNTDGIEEFMAAKPQDANVRLVSGIELSIEPGAGFDKFHLLGLGVDRNHPALYAFLRKILDGRNERNRKIVENFARLGIELGSEIGAYAHGEVLARPHFARWLVEHRHASSIAEAFDTYLLPESPVETRCYEERYHPSQEETFAVIHAAGGLCVMAHPKYWRRTWKDVGCDYATAAKELAELKEKGLDGLESIYQANCPAENVEFTCIAERLKLLKSAGSDFHGAHKPTIPLGMEVSDRFIAPLLDRLQQFQKF